ncbi:MAG: hypothetical protein J6Q05_05210, partial [Elusimicrobiaceae bacterium]|nr:hypothetical protein [Elusimicrobiaceae bacterium]
AEFDKDGKMFGDATLFKIHQEVTDWVKADQTLSAPAWSSQFFHLGSSAQSGKFHTMGSTLLLQKDAMPLAFPVAVQMQLKRAFHKGIKGVDSRTYQRVLISEKDGKLLFGFGTDLASPLKPSQFKLILDETEIPFLLRATQSYTGPALEIKLTAPSGSFFSKRWTAFKQAGQEGHWNPFPTLFRGKNNIYVHEIPVSLRQADGTLARLPLTFQADSYLGLRGANAVLEEGGKLAWYRGENLLQTPKLTYSLPKKQIRPFLQVLRTSGLQQPLHITALPSKNKITPLMWATGLSLSSASTGLIAPLENIYGNNITETDKTLISLAFPYLPSLAAPLFSPLVMKIGALRTLQLALGISTAGLAFATFNGFPGIMDKNNLPPIWPLFVSGTAIGISSALSRAGLNLLIDSMGGKGSLLKSMAFKNIGSLALLLPPFVFNFVNKDIDFSLAFPVLGTLSAGSLLWVSSSRINTELGKMAGFMPLKPFSTFRPATWKNLGSNWLTIGKGAYEETRNTFRLLRTREVLPLVLAATAFTGFEAGSFNKATNQMMNNMWRPHVNSMVENGYMPESNRKNTTNILANLAVICFPLFTRLASNPLTEALKTQRAGDEFRRILLGSFTLNGIGAYLLYNNGLGSSPSLLDNILGPGMLGVAMIGVGTANMTQSFQKLSNITILQSKYAKMLTKGLSKEAKATVEDALKTKTMTGFPMQQLGLAIVPTIVSGYTDRQIAEGTIQKKEAPQSSLWIPITSLALCFSLAAPSILDFVPSRIPTGVLGLSKGIFGSYSNAFKQLFQQPSYLPQPLNKMQNGLSSPLLRPAMNMSPFTPTQNPLENKLEYELTAPQPTPAADQPATQEPVQE